MATVLFSENGKQRKVNIKEIKFYHAGQNTKRQFLSGIASVNFKIFAIIIDKKNRKIIDSPENFSMLVRDLISDMIKWYKNTNYFLLLTGIFIEKLTRANLID